MRSWCGLGSVLVFSTACGTLPLRPGHYAITGAGADYPVMMSRAPSRDRGRHIEATSAYDSRQGGAAFVAGGAVIYVEVRRRNRSEIPASERLLLQVRRKERWLQFDGAQFAATNKTEPAQEIVTRSLIVQASAHR